MGSCASVEREASGHAIRLVIVNRVMIGLEACLQTVFAHQLAERITEVEARRGLVQHSTIAEVSIAVDRNRRRAALGSIGGVRGTGRATGHGGGGQEAR